MNQSTQGLTVNQPKQFDFIYTRKGRVENSSRHGRFSITISQSQFEDYQVLKQHVHKALTDLGLWQAEKPCWHEAPVVAPSTVEKLRAAIGASSEAQFIAAYAHSSHHQTYKKITVDGVAYRWESFSSGHFIKFAPALVTELCEVSQA